MLKAFSTDENIYYFNSENFTLSTSEIASEMDIVREHDEGILKKVVINISNNCNLSCVYCYADGGNYGMTNQLMDVTTANKIIEELCNDGIQVINRLILFGGEPFLNIDLFVYIIKELSKNIEIKKIETVTNGTVLNQKVKSMIDCYHPFLTVSLDGPELIHDKLRGKGSHRRTMKFIDYLKKIDYENFELASTYTRMHQKLGFQKEDIYNYFINMEVRFNINHVFSKNKVLVVKEMEMTEEVQKTFIDQSLDDIINNKVKNYISPIVYDVLLSMIFKSKTKSFCDDIDPETTVTFDVDGTRKSCFRFWGTHNSDKVAQFNNKDTFAQCKDCWCKDMCMECVANMIDGYSQIISEEGKFLECQKQDMMEYCIYKIIELSKDKNRLSKLVNHFERFLRYA
ncbi:streptosactin maturase GggB [Streptococcus himalayensis]|uniref:Radical SAM/SPASM domain-containing protein n=1 Tax=Streptococcus himalayensis TaxID=1888195 RepID=A0A917A682_9STRE|nr:radical SAM protein [Streptococcus himalayensis]GGE30674.1 radical SAM/SPASM domain-containing protein [Streptococcus himalayensis]